VLTRAKLKVGEGKIKNFNPKIGRATRRRKMGDEELHTKYEKNFHKALYQISNMVEKMFADYNKRVGKKENKKKAKVEDDAVEDQGIAGDSPEPPYPSSSLSSSSSSSHSHHSNFHQNALKNPLLKLDVKFNFPMFNGEANVDKLNIWIRQIEVYYCVQQIEEEEENIQLDSLQLEGTTLVWWERKLQKGSKHNGKILNSWSEFTSMLKK